MHIGTSCEAKFGDKFYCIYLTGTSSRHEELVKLSELVSVKLQLKENLNGTSCVLEYEVSLRNLLGISAGNFSNML